MKTGKKVWLALGILAVLSGGFGAQAATLEIDSNADVENIKAGQTINGATWVEIGSNGKYYVYNQSTPSGNVITVENAKIEGNLYGGVTQSTMTTGAANNSVTIQSGELTNVTGGQINYGVYNADSNQVAIHGGSISGNVNGGIVGAKAGGTASQNKIIIDGGAVAGTVIGANIQTTDANGKAVENEVSISGNAEIKNDVYGASVDGDAATAEKNKVTISGGSFSNKSIIGGYKYFYDANSAGNIVGNTVDVTGGTFNQTNVYGGYIRKGGSSNVTNTGIVSDNMVTITGVTADGNGSQIGRIYGGQNYNGDAVSNSVIIKDSKLSGVEIYGGASSTGAVTGNTVEINGTSEIQGKIYAGYTSGTGEVTGNTLIVNGGTINADALIAGYGQGEVSGNVLKLNGGTITGKISGFVGGTLSNNRIEVGGNVNLADAEISYGENSALVFQDNGGTIKVKQLSAGTNGVISFAGLKFSNDSFTLQDNDADMTGKNDGASWAQSTKSIQINSFEVSEDELAEGTAITKIVAINGVRFGTKDSDPGIDKVNLENLKKDHVNITKNGVNAYQFTVELNQDSFISDGTKNDNDKNNSKIIIDASVEKSILAGKYNSADGKYANTTATGTLSTESGALTLDGTNASTQASMIAGAYNDGSGAATDGNVIIDSSFAGKHTVYGGYSKSGDATGNTISLGGINNDSLSLFGGKSEAASATVSGNTLSVTGENSVKSVSKFDKISFNDVKLDSTMLKVADTAGLADVKGYDVNISTDQTLTVGGSATLVETTDGTYQNYTGTQKDFMQGAGLAISGSLSKSEDGNNLVAKIDSIKASSHANDVAVSHVTAIGFLNEGSDLVLTGIGSLVQDDVYGIQTFAATERSDSSYDGGTDIDGWKVIAGVGAQHKVSSGALAWGVFAERGLGSYTTSVDHGSGDVEYNGGGAALRYTKDNGVYAEASIRLGKLHDDVDGVLGGYDYDTSADYKAFHAGVGKLIKAGSGTWDVYGKYFYTKADDVGFTVNNQYYGLDSIESQRIRLGARYNYQANSHLGLYYGAAWEYEFDGDTNGSVEGYALDTASLGGSTFLGEVGLTYKPKADSRWDFEFGIKGYGGERDGMSGVLRGAYHF